MNSTVKNIAFFVLLIIASTNIQAQNLVYNGDFEIYDTCPTSNSSLGDYQIEHCLGWYSPTYATPDYFNICVIWPFIVGVPQSSAGYQEPFSGNGYLGFLSYADEIIDSIGTIYPWREYVQSELLTTLVEGRTYAFKFYVSLAEMSQLSSSKIGAWFSDYAYTTSDSEPIPFAPQVMNVAGNFITDTVNWTVISGSFVANGDEKYITIGSFADTINVDTLRVKSNPHVSSIAYYFLDGLVLWDINDSLNDDENILYIPNIFSPNGDGENDVLYLRGQNIKEIEFAVYDRWGNKVFECNDISKGWDGTYMDQLCDPAVFVYYTRSIFMDGVQLDKKGNITLIR